MINGVVFDGASKDPMQQAMRDALIAFMAATARAQVEATKEAQKAGIEAAKADAERYRGKKPSDDRATFTAVCDHLALGRGASEIAKETGLSRQTVLRIRDQRADSEAALSRWGL